MLPSRSAYLRSAYLRRRAQMKDSATFGGVLRRYRLAAGLTQEALARQAGLSLRGLSDLERGARRFPRQETIECLVTALRLSDTERRTLIRARRRPAVQVRASPRSRRPRSNLPAPLTSFVGRERERADVRRLLASSRLLTLTGPGGSGKTRLAVQVAAELVVADPGGPDHPYADGIWLIELAAMVDPALLPHTVATTLSLGVHESAAVGDPDVVRIGALADRLQTRRLLLVLDNCEHVVEACAVLAELLLQACSGLRILATSRQPLGLAGETIWQVPSLGVPDVQPASTLAALVAHDAVRLFVERARSAHPGFELHDGNASDVVQICRRLDGMPLAIELAAAVVRHLSPRQIVARLDDRFRLLASGRRTMLPRHRTLRRAIDWSHDLLSAPERALFRRLVVFAGGWTLDGGEAICDGGTRDAERGASERDPSSPLDSHPSTLDTLASLVDKSLVLAEEHAGTVRYRLLETIRHYGLEKLRESGESESLRAGHRDWFLALAEAAWPRLAGPDQAEWLTRLEVEHDNFRAALTWSRADSTDAELRLVASLSRFWWRRGYLSEGRDLVRRALERDSRPPSRVRAMALAGAAVLERAQGDHVTARASFEESLAIFRGLGDRWGAADVLQSLAATVEYQGDSDRAQALVEESLAIFRELDDTDGIASALGTLGQIMHRRREYDRSEVLLEESLALSRAAGNTWRVTVQLSRLGSLLLDLDQHARAVPLLEESLSLKRALVDRPDAAWVLSFLGRAAVEQGHLERAMALLAESVTLFQELDLRWGIATCLGYLARAAALRRQPDRAVRLLGAAETLIETGGTPRSPADCAIYEPRLAALRATLGERRFAAAWAAGRKMPPEQAIADALSPHESRAPSSGPAGTVPVGRAASAGVEAGVLRRPMALSPLTPRELDVLRLVAEGLSNDEIGARLVLSPHTVHRHVANVLNKLGVPTRAAAAAYGARHGLL